MYSGSWPFFRLSRYTAHSVVWSCVVMPAFARSAAIASAISFGFGKYGRERDMYQKISGSFLPSSPVISESPCAKPACVRSSRALAGGVRRTQEELKARVALDDRDVVRVEAFHAVDLARFQGAEPLGVVFDVPHDDALHPGLDTPVARVRLEDDLLVRLPLDELEGARADRVLPELQAPFLYRLR